MRRFASLIGNFVANPKTIGFVILLSVLVIHRIDFFNHLNRLAYDMMVWKRGQRFVPQRVAIADIDEKSLRALGRWPWPRKVMAELFEKLEAMDAKVIAFDGTFSEADQTTGLENIRRIRSYMKEQPLKGSLKKSLDERLATMEYEEDGDERLRQTITEMKSDVVLGLLMHLPQRGLGVTSDSVNEASLQERVESVRKGAINFANLGGDIGPLNSRFIQIDDIVTPIAKLAEAADGFGYFNDFHDKDGTSRTIFPIYPVQDFYLPSLSLAAAAKYLEGTPQLMLFEDGEQTLQIIDSTGQLLREVPIDDQGRIFANYYGPLRTLSYYSIIDILEDRVPKEAFAGKAVFVGSSAPGVFDLVKVPFEIFRGWKTPGVELQATLAANIIYGNYLEEDFLYYLLLLIIIPLTVIFILPRADALAGLAFIIILSALEVYFCFWLFLTRDSIVWVAVPLITLLLLYLGITLAKYRAEESQRRFIKHAFGHYLSPTLVEQISSNPDLLHLSGERKELSVLFSDIRDFTSISERLTPAALRDLLASYLTPMTDIITKQNMGTLDKYIGDAIMAFYNAPVDLENHPTAACKSALQMMVELKKLKSIEDFPAIDIGIGINTGEVSVGNMGSDTVFDYTALGDAVNLASRLEGITKQYGVSIITSVATYENAKEQFTFRELDRIRVKGKAEAVTIYQVYGGGDITEVNNEEKELIEIFHQALISYREQQWDAAMRSFEECLKINPDDLPAALFVERCQLYKQNPHITGDSWDGVYIFTSK